MRLTLLLRISRFVLSQVGGVEREMRDGANGGLYRQPVAQAAPHA
jgi:hypothetical protein